MDGTTEALVDAILRSPRIANRLVILCEGDPLPLEQGQVAASPQMYGRLERTPDASFYAACVPNDWHGVYLPQFFTCGGRSQVLQVYAALHAEHQRRGEESYLTPSKLFAIVDLDLQSCALPSDLSSTTTEDVHEALYLDGRLKPLGAEESFQIWVTALVHKEAFFLLPLTEDALYGGVRPFLDGAPLCLRAAHRLIVDSILDTPDVRCNFPMLRARLGRFSASERLDLSSCERLGASWQAEAQTSGDEEYEEMVWGLLAVGKAKPAWSKIRPDPNAGCTLPDETFREQLALGVGRRIAQLEPDEHPLRGFFAWLKPRR